FYLSLPVGGNVISTPMVITASPQPEPVRLVAVLAHEPETVRVFQRYLDGMEVVHVGNAVDLRNLLDERPVHALVVTNAEASRDWQIARMQDQRLGGLPTFTCSLSSHRLFAEELGVAEYLTKPVSRERLVAALCTAGKTAQDILVVDDDPEMVRLLGEMA